MLALQSPNKTPPGAFRYRQPETGKTFRSICHNAILNEIAAHRKRHGLDLSPGWQDRADAEMCEQNGWGGGVCFDTEAVKVREITSGNVKDFLAVLATVLANGGALVDQSEAERRAAICAGCPHNIDVPGCLGMCPGSLAKSLMRFAAAFHWRKLQTSRDGDLRSCGVCGCANAAQVHVSLDTLRRVKGGFEFPDHCWKK